MSTHRPLSLGLLLECAILLLLLQTAFSTGRPEPRYLVDPQFLKSVTRIGLTQGSTVHWIRREEVEGVVSWIDEARNHRMRIDPEEILRILGQPLPAEQPRQISGDSAGVLDPSLVVTLQTSAQTAVVRIGIPNRSLQLRYAQVEGADRVLLLSERLFTVGELALNDITGVTQSGPGEETLQAVEMQ